MPNLTGARKRVEKLMTATCEVYDDQLRLTDATLNRVTGQLVPNPAADPLVYSGPCMVTRSQRRELANEGLADGREKAAVTYDFSIPFSAPPMRKGFVVKIIAADDPGTQGSTFTISDTERGSLMVMRRAQMTLVETDRDD